MRGARGITGKNRLQDNFPGNTLSNLNVAIIGAGIAGLSAALFLKQLKCNVTVFEKEEFVKSEGAGIQITPNGSFVLKRLGLDDPVIRAGIKPNNFCLFDEDDFKSIGSLEILARLKGRYGKSFITLRRSLLVRILFEKVKEEKIQIKFGSRALPLVEKNEEDVYILYKGKKINKDLIVVADGVSSSWKQTIFKEIKNRSISQCAYRFVLNNKRLPSIFSKNNINLFFGRGRHFVAYPTGNDGMINFVFCKRESGKMVNHWKEKVPIKQFLNEFEINDALRSCVLDIKNVYRWPVIESEVPITIQKKNVVMVGDAAHAMLPYMAQGANKALEDSWELSECIKEFPLDLGKGLSRYSKKRIRRIRRLDKVSQFNEKVYHLEQKILRRIFFIFLRLTTIIAPNSFFKRLDWIYRHKG